MEKLCCGVRRGKLGSSRCDDRLFNPFHQTARWATDGTPETAGGSTSYTVTVSASGGYAGTVGLAVTAGMPGGATASFSPSTVNNGSGSVTLKIQTSSSTSAGTYMLTITGTDNSGTSATKTHTVGATLVVNTVHGKH